MVPKAPRAGGETVSEFFPPVVVTGFGTQALARTEPVMAWQVQPAGQPPAVQGPQVETQRPL
ncbi:MAG: hypothetical protein B7Z78_13460 [Rhodospirillales bacterium 20-60-12]|nr:MAG: hypothetical protein B7Z78_13460 [Rhodospirillales bacterium 20-60-12]